MKKTEAPKKMNLLEALAKRKAEAQASGEKSNIMSKDLSNKFTSDVSWSKKPTKRGGRNGQGKP